LMASGLKGALFGEVFSYGHGCSNRVRAGAQPVSQPPAPRDTSLPVMGASCAATILALCESGPTLILGKDHEVQVPHRQSRGCGVSGVERPGTGLGALGAPGLTRFRGTLVAGLRGHGSTVGSFPT
jgi:hypothetical protein